MRVLTEKSLDMSSHKIHGVFLLGKRQQASQQPRKRNDILVQLGRYVFICHSVYILTLASITQSDDCPHTIQICIAPLSRRCLYFLGEMLFMRENSTPPTLLRKMKVLSVNCWVNFADGSYSIHQTFSFCNPK